MAALFSHRITPYFVVKDVYALFGFQFLQQRVPILYSKKMVLIGSLFLITQVPLSFGHSTIG